MVDLSITQARERIFIKLDGRLETPQCLPLTSSANATISMIQTTRKSRWEDKFFLWRIYRKTLLVNQKMVCSTYLQSGRSQNPWLCPISITDTFTRRDARQRPHVTRAHNPYDKPDPMISKSSSTPAAAHPALPSLQWRNQYASQFRNFCKVCMKFHSHSHKNRHLTASSLSRTVHSQPYTLLLHL